jgi:hypothetical protein
MPMIDEPTETPDIVDETLTDSPESTAPEDTLAPDSADADTPSEADPDQPTTAADDNPALAAVVPPSSAPAPEPFTLKAHGKTLTLDGATRIAGEGLRIPEGPALQRAQQLMARGVEMETFGRQRIKELELHTQSLQREQSEAEVHASAIISWFNEVSQSPETMVDVLTNWAQHKPLFDVRVEKAKFEAEKARAEWSRKAQEPTPQEQQQQVLAGAKAMGEEVLAELAPTHGLTPQETAAIAARLLRRPELYVIEQQGRLAFDDVTFAEDVAAEAEARKTVRTSVTAAQEAASTNAKRAAGTIPATTRAPSGNVTPGQPRDRQTGKFTSREEWEAHMRGE